MPSRSTRSLMTPRFNCVGRTWNDLIFAEIHRLRNLAALMSSHSDRRDSTTF
jgi:hypothetical protein